MPPRGPVRLKECFEDSLFHGLLDADTGVNYMASDHPAAVVLLQPDTHLPGRSELYCVCDQVRENLPESDTVTVDIAWQPRIDLINQCGSFRARPYPQQFHN